MSNMVKIKICGITNLKDAQDAVSFGADAIGFIFAKSVRSTEPATAKSIIERLGRDVMKVGVFVNETIDNVRRVAEHCGLDTIQLHGDENPEYCSKLEKLRIIKAFRIKDDTSLTLLPNYKDVFAYLLDTFSKEVYGGTGKAFDWNLAVKAKSFGKPIILSGGLRLDNIEEALRFVTPYGVDISSSIEQKPGKKDTTQMKEIISAIKGLDL
jgi:phosphoribosylanthranilate isomerase